LRARLRRIEAGTEDERGCVWVHVMKFADEVAAVAVGQAEVDDGDVDVVELRCTR
jgi:hypothetical protein